MVTLVDVLFLTPKIKQLPVYFRSPGMAVGAQTQGHREGPCE